MTDVDRYKKTAEALAELLDYALRLHFYALPPQRGERQRKSRIEPA